MEEPELLVLESDELRVEVLPTLGARLHSIRAFGVDLMHTPPDAVSHSVNPFFWGGYHMLPWCNRIAPGPVDVLGRTIALPSNFADGTAIHGLHYVAPWRPLEDGTLECSGGESDTGWPWAYSALVTFSVAGPRLTVSYTLSNRSDDPMPAGVGFHPWFRRPTRLGIPAARAFADNTDTAVQPDPVEGQFDLRTAAAPAIGIDASWVDLDPAVVTLDWDDLGIRLEFSADDPSIVAVAANPPDVGGLAVELQTHAPAGMRRLLDDEPYALRVLAPGDSLELTLTLAFARHT